MKKLTKKNLSQVEKNFLLWGNLLDAGIELCSNLHATKGGSERLPAYVIKALRAQSEEHWKGLYNALSKIR